MRTGISWLDVKLGARMLIKYPGLTLVGGLGMAVAIALGAGFFAFSYAYLNPTLPLDEGERVVGIENWDAAWNNPESRILHDFVTWREEVRSVEDLGAFRPTHRNLIVPGGQGEPVAVAEMTASGFRVARVPPLLGRPLVDEDEREGAPPVVVIGHDVWQTRFEGDPSVVGRDIRLGGTVHTVVGVMPEGFAFPVNHRFWTPLQADPSDYERRRGPGIRVFGRLAPGATLDQAQAELAAIGRRTAAAFPETHERLRPRVMPYTDLWIDADTRGEFQLVQLLVTLLLVVICVNVAVLVYARTATRQGEITVRSALGASRRRIVTQFFVEALVLAALAATVGLLLADFALGQVDVFMDMGTAAPFWLDFGLSTATILYVVGLVVLAAAIVGVIPAMKATGRHLQSNLRQMGGGTGMQMGRTWTVLIVAQVAFAVAILPETIFYAGESVRHMTAEPGFPAEEFLTAQLGMDRESPPTAEAEAYQREFTSRFGARLAELVSRLEAEPGVAGATFASGVPGYEPESFLEVDGVPSPPSSAAGHKVQLVQVDADFLEVFGAPILAGRQFHSGDAGEGATAVIVNQAFVRQVLGGGNAVGHRVRKVGVVDDDEGTNGRDLGPWYEIVGVAGDLPASAIEPGQVEARVYQPVAPGQVHPVSLAVRVQGTAPAGFTGRLREITTVLDPTLELQEVLPLDEFYGQKQEGLRLTALAVAIGTLSVLLLSAAGIYALMSFTVTRRRREIGIRSALGAHPRQIIAGIFSRALKQLAIGVALGVLMATVLLMGGGHLGGLGTFLLFAVSALMLVVGLFAAVGPARRGLRIQPTEALREG